GSYEFVVQQDGVERQVFTVQGVIGGGHMIGGGTQGFVAELTDGTERFLPWDWSAVEAVWFCNTGSRRNRGWVPITPDMTLADCGDWPPLRPLGTVERFANCQQCHGSQILTTLDADRRSYRTEYTTLRVNCESCHGPARRHVEMAASGGFTPDGDIGLQSLAGLSKDESLNVCFQCHALKDVLREGYLPGEPLEQYFALKFPVLGDRPYFADGRVSSFAYQGNHLASACYLKGPMDCVSCHEPHNQGYWDVDRRRLSSPFDDQQCTACHASKLEPIEAHTFHPAESEGSRCVSCHMPYLQHPEIGDQIAFARSDHTIAIPRPVFDADLGLQGACAQCHEDRSALELQSQVREWWGELKPHRPAVQGQVDELRARNAAEAGEMLLHPEEVDPLVQFQALSTLLVGYLRPDDAQTPESIVDDLITLSTNPDLDLRALSLASLHWVQGDDPVIRGALVAALSSAESDAALRGRWMMALGFIGDRHRDRGEIERSMAAYRKALELRPNDPRVLRARAQLYSTSGDYPSAIRDLQQSLAQQPEQPLAWNNLGNARAAVGDVSGAREAYLEAIQINANEALAHFNLGNTYLRADDLESAVESYLRAVEADPGLGVAQFEIGRAYILLGRHADALPYARRAVEFRPEHGPSREMLRDLELATGR
ncbi:MAG: tetratricopeptide repeat protein, partial [Deltaproteobacteria bacterium]|nr:tetratricopeptide repeat protein [Deltaproteobacteria bacterium]